MALLRSFSERFSKTFRILRWVCSFLGHLIGGFLRQKKKGINDREESHGKSQIDPIFFDLLSLAIENS